tara:strand:+ start:422 stop:943 length:522 start_codon:yes stop_codon:yes gene_type:complete
MSFKRPRELMFAQPLAFALDHLYFAHTKTDPNEGDFYNPLGREMLCGIALPDFQRPAVWDEAQQVALIDSLWRAVPIGTYSVNFSLSARALPPSLRNILIDGQQRIRALVAYWDDVIEYEGYTWSQLSELDRRHFLHRPFPQMRTDSRNRDEVLEYYNVMNFGGTPHREEDRA